MSKVFRSLAAAVAVILSVLTFVPSVAHAGVAAGISPTFPSTVTVGQTGLPASIVLRNNNDGGEAAFVNTVCNFGDAIPPCTPADPTLSLIEDIGINAILACSEIGVASTCAPAGADPGVFQASSTGTGSGACAGITFDILEKPDAYGTLRFTPQTGPNVLLSGTGAECTIDFTFSVLKMPVDQDPAEAGVQSVQIADNAQWSSNLNNDVRGTDDMTVLKATPNINTTATADLDLGTGPLIDTATITGRAFPDTASTVSFRLYGPGDATCAAAPVFEDLNVAYPQGGGPVSSAAYAPVQIGTYRWVATYDGDSNNNSVAGVCGDATETLVVGQAHPAIVTTASDNQDLGDGQLSDSAVVTGRVGPIAGATVDFRLYGPGDATCANAPVFETLGVDYSVAGGVVSSGTYTAPGPGTYRWVAHYSGDANNEADAGSCGDDSETTVVSKAQPALVTSASDDIAIGAEITDVATVTGRFDPLDSTIDFRLYGPNDDTCSNAAVFTSLGVPYPIAGGDVNSLPFEPTEPGVYRWVATYNGDANNSSAQGVCGDVTETVGVFRGIPTIETTASGDVFLGDGTALTDTATVDGRVEPVAGATVDFRLYGPNDDTCAGTPVFESLDVPYTVAGGPVVSGAFTPTVAGTYRWIASYSGDINNSAVSGFCGDAAETVEVAPTPNVDDELPETGPAGMYLTLWGGAASMLLGGLLLGFTSRRRRHSWL